MERHRTPRRRADAPSVAPTTLTEIARRYYACAVALAKAMGVPLTETFLREHRESISCCFIEAGRAGVRLPPAVVLPSLTAPSAPSQDLTEGEHVADAPVRPPETLSIDNPITTTNGDAPPLTAADLPTRIPAGLELPCAEALIVDLRPPQLSLLIGKVGLKALADPSFEPLHVALLAERAHRLANGRKTPVAPEADGHDA